MAEFNIRERTVVACVVLLCITAVICCWLLKPPRYVVVESPNMTTKVLDLQTGDIVTPKFK